jgi:hypothetical protein
MVGSTIALVTVATVPAVRFVVLAKVAVVGKVIVPPLTTGLVLIVSTSTFCVVTILVLVSASVVVGLPTFAPSTPASPVADTSRVRPAVVGASGKAAVGPEAPTAFTPSLKRAQETDLLVYDVYVKIEVPLDALQRQVEAIRVPHCKVVRVEPLENSPAEGINRLRVSAVLKDSTEKSVLLVEEALLHLQHGNHGAVSSVAFRGYTKSF